MSKIKVTVKNNFSGEIKRIKKIRNILHKIEENQSQWGYFDGEMHPSAEVDGERITLAVLMAMHESGFTTPSGNFVPARPVLHLSLEKLKNSSEQAAMQRVLSKYVAEALSGDNKSIETLEALAEIGRNAAYQIFGSSALEDTKDGTPPLIDTGALRDNIRSKVG